MRVLNESETEQVSGGFVPALAVIGGAAVSGYSSWANGDSWQGIAASAALGGLGGVAGTMAKITRGAIRIKYGLQGGGMTIASNTITGSSPGTSDVGDAEKVLEK